MSCTASTEILVFYAAPSVVALACEFFVMTGESFARREIR